MFLLCMNNFVFLHKANLPSSRFHPIIVFSEYSNSIFTRMQSSGRASLQSANLEASESIVMCAWIVNLPSLLRNKLISLSTAVEDFIRRFPPSSLLIKTKAIDRRTHFDIQRKAESRGQSSWCPSQLCYSYLPASNLKPPPQQEQIYIFLFRLAKFSRWKRDLASQRISRCLKGPQHWVCGIGKLILNYIFWVFLWNTHSLLFFSLFFAAPHSSFLRL